VGAESKGIKAQIPRMIVYEVRAGKIAGAGVESLNSIKIWVM
jgi:hypothetical protein